ncbi:MAG: sulfatase [Planctomycetota bacterium]
MGAAVFGLLGAAEAGAFGLFFDDPEPLGVLRRAVLGGAALGLGVGLAWGIAVEALFHGFAPVRRASHGVFTLVVQWVAFTGIVHAQRHALPPGAAVGGTLSLTMLGGHALAAVLLLATLRAVCRCAPLERGHVIARPARAVLVMLAGLLGVSALPDDGVGASATPGPDVLFVVLDTTRADRFPPDASAARAPTPTFDALANEGVVFGQARSASPWTLPSHASMFTGALPSEHGATSEHPHLDGRLPTLAERLGAAGLHTVAFARKGWLNRQTGVLRGFRQVYDLLDPPPLPALLELQRRLFEPDEPDDQGGLWLTMEAGNWFVAHPDVPRFAFLNYDEAHSPLRPPEPYRSLALGPQLETPWGLADVPHAQRFNTGLESYTPDDFEVFRRLYDAEITYQDDLLGGLLRVLEASGRLDETLVIVTSDHGEHLGEHGLLGHDFSLYDTVLRVPLVLRYPKALPAGLVVDTPVETRLLGALIEAVRAHDGEAPLGADAIVRLLSGPLPAMDASGAPTGAPTGPAIVSELYRPPFGSKAWSAYPRKAQFDRRMKSLLLDGTKYIWGSDGRDALYAPLEDPEELRDLLATLPDLAASLRAALLADPRLWPAERSEPAPELGEELLEHLHQTGYLR